MTNKQHEVSPNTLVMERRVIALRGLTDAEYENIKALAKDELPFRVSIRRWKRQYAYHQIDIRPYGKGVYRWETKEFEAVLAFVEKHNLIFNTSHLDPLNWELIFNNGFTFMGYLANKK